MFFNTCIPMVSPRMRNYQVSSCFLSVKGGKLDWLRIATQLKNCGNPQLIMSATDDIAHHQGVIDRVIWGNAMPASIKNLGNGANCYFFKPVSLDNELGWVITGLRRYKKQLHEFVQIRDAVERHILLGNYTEAHAILDESLKKVGYTVWYYEMKLLIYGYQDNLQAVLTTLSNVNKEKKSDKVGIVSELLNYLANRSLKNSSAIEYDINLVSRYKRNRNDFQNDRYNYFLFRLNYYQHYDIDDLSVTLIMESLNSAIDRYNLLLYVLRSYLIKEPEHMASVLHFARKLYRMSGDSLLYPFLAINNVQKMPEDYYSEEFIRILDYYYTGKYEETITACRNFLLKDPSNFDVVKLYSRALLFLHRGFRNIDGNKDCILNEIAFNVYRVMTEKDNDQYKDTLYKLNKHIYGFQIAAGLDYFIREERNTSRCETLRQLSMTCFDPYFNGIFQDDDIRLEYIEAALQRMPHSKALNYQHQRILKEVIEDTSIVSYIRDVDNAKILFENGKYEEALEKWKVILDDNHDITPTAQTAVEYIFRSYMKLGVEYRQQAVRFYIDKYIDNKAFVSKIDTHQFLADIKKQRYEGIRNNIDFLLFIFLNAEKYPQKQFVLERYCKYEGVNYPSELIELMAGKSPAKVELFFYILLTDDILYHHYKLKSTMDVLEEKLKIVSFLRMKSPDVKRYSAIYTELMHELIAYRGMKKLDDSKIYVNEEAVFKYELQGISDLYDRFKKQAALANQDRVYYLVGGLDYSSTEKNAEMINNVATYSDNVIAEAATQLFDVIRRAFLKSRFGLGTYLSTRIRHGVFEGELRSGLARLNLVYSTEGTTYIPSHVWQREFNLDAKSNDILNKSIIEFSKKIDHLISEFKDTVIQIHVDENDNMKGDFNYEVSTDDICTRFLQIESTASGVEDFCRQVMVYLWEITEQRLEKIRGKVKNELAPGMFALLIDLESSIQSLSTVPELYKQLNSTINKAREELTAKLAKVEKWFYRQATKYDDFLLDNHMQMALESAVKYIPELNETGNELSLDIKLHIRSEYSASMFDLFTIFFSNMLKYCKKEQRFSFGISPTVKDGHILHLQLVNDLPDGTDEDRLNQIFYERLQDQCRLQKEKGSGLVKAMNILQFEFGDQNNYFTIVAKDGKCHTDIYFNLNEMLVDTSQLNHLPSSIAYE